MTSIFQIDWIFVDTIIIILLFLLLFSVKIFKITHRWRKSFSNQALEHNCLKKTREKVKNQKFLPKKWCLTTNSSLKKEFSKFPLILICRTTYFRKFLRILTEGLSTYGFNVINVKVKIKHLSDNATIESLVNNEWKSLLSALIDDFKLAEFLINPKYILLNQSNSIIHWKHILSDSNNKGVILINPKLKNKDLSEYSDFIKKYYKIGQIYTIFSRKSILILKNKHLAKFLKVIAPQRTDNSKFLTIKKANYSFKYYETIVLGMIIDIIENKLLKSKT
jgi:hypothetical protein